MPARVLVVGSANVDYTVAVSRLPAPGETVSEGTLLVNHGGKGANQAVAARRLGADVRLIACVGQDPSGDAIREALVREGIGVDGVVTSPAAATGTALITVDAYGRNQIAVAPGANRALTAAHLEARAADFEWAQVVVVSLEIPLATAVLALETARRHRVLTVLNPAPVPPTHIDFWRTVDIATPNESEAARLSGVAVADEAGATAVATALCGRGVATVAITLGDRGVMAVTANGVTRVPAFPVTAVDTTGAGDAFNAGLAVATAEGVPLESALRFACATAGLTCTRRGAQPSLPRRSEVEELLAR